MDKLEKYLEGELSESEQQEFESEMAANPALAEKVALHRRLDAALGNREEMAVEANLGAILAQATTEETPASPKRRSFRTYYMVAAAVVLLALVIVSIPYLRNPKTPGELFTEYYDSYDASRELRSEGGIPKSLLTEAFDQYEKGAYQEAENAFQDILELSPGNPRAHFYLGICFLEKDAYDKASSEFDLVLAHAKNLYISQSMWYRAMSSLGLGEVDKAAKDLKTLAGEAGRYQQRAADLLADLGK